MLQFIALPPSVCCLYYTLVCIYVGASRSLICYSVRKDTESSQDLSNTENSLISLKAAMSIPFIATGTLLVTYLAVINQVTIVNQLLNAYFMFVGVLTIKKYLYAYA